MGTIKFYTMLKGHFTRVDTRLLCEFLLKTMFRFGCIFLASVYTLMLKILGFISKYAYRSKSGVAEGNGSNFSANRSQKDDQVVSKNSTVFLSSGLAGKESFDLQNSKEDSNGNIADTEGSVFLQSGLIANSSKCQFMSGKNVNGYLEEPKTVKYVVQEMFVGSNEVLVSSDQSLGCEISKRKESFEQKLEKNLVEFDDESDSFSFCFNLFNASCSTNEDTQGHMSELVNRSQERADNPFTGLCSEEVYQEKEKLNTAGSKDYRVEGIDSVKDEILEDQDFSYEVELLPLGQSSTLEANQESDAAGNDILISTRKIESTDKAFLERNDSKNWKTKFLDETDQRKPEDLEEERYIDHTCLTIRNSLLGTERVEDLDDEYIELEPLSVNLTHIGKESASSGDANKAQELHEQDIMQSEAVTSLDSSQEQKNFWDSDSDDDEPDVLWEHQHLVQQMKMELKNCRIRGLPTISEECETPKMVEDLKPLKIDQKIEYKDIMEEIQKFYKSYMEKMRKLDILNYQTLHAISFLQLKESEVFTAGKKKADSVPFNLPKIWPRKVQRIYADPMHKLIIEMHRDLELVYVGQLCLSWEILCWLYVKAQELLEYDSEGNHSYNRAAEEFQQFQVLMQRFIEDEPFQGHRNQNYVKSRCMTRSLLKVPTIKDDCLKAKKEQREETDAISLELLVEFIRESMLIFREFLFADKRATNVVLKGIQGTKVDLQNPENSELLVDIISNLQKKERRIREHIKSQNCIVKKFKKHQECGLNRELLTSQVDLRLVSRVLSLSRLTTDQLVWCQKKLNNINFVSRKVHMEPSFSLFPC
ncbi:hypothetical protein Pfo_009503 [Paulownia fortunei]|nr:hypothetical protein Pfo_009503 [Paulownia fortunei]